MAVEVKIPAVGESISSGVVSVWHKKSGDFVNTGDALFTLETDKVSTEIAAETSGVLDTLVPEGQEVKIGEVVATIDDSKKVPAAKKSVGDAVDTSPARTVPGKPTASPTKEKSTDGETLSPSVRRIVDEEQLDPAKISGTGPGGRITKADALAAANKKSVGDAGSVSSEVKQTAPPAEDRQSSDGRVVRKKMSPLRRKIAAQLVMAQQTAAILTTFNECDMSAVQKLRADSQNAFTKKHGVKLGFMSFFIKASVEALKAVPVVNGRIEGDDFIENNFYDIGVAVGTERGLVVPIVRDADKKSFADLEREIGDFAVRAREGKLKFEDLTGGTFTVSNGGVYGSLVSTPILNFPQSGILGMHKIMPRPVAIDGKVEIRPMMYLALSYDHRLIDGKEAVTFLIKVKECIEDPKKLPLDF
ncbi:MAG TPA: 2-oxoglutarate dehydrogenase complex dihydrolipoyllysine-residue succinyltransferase [Chthoniobacterales bacterium]|jgi:2-oxoglutarate dehydrogenase E2 component (dihydrolipoamide succinyltransferase)|nr:2-oxoglutarate dehydrogenase complex dihydrolipoyllysine-residue succinyltransferase [Chthoniobacterales bacterium]